MSLVLALLVASLLLIAANLPVNHDVAWLLHVGAVTARGGTPYRDVLEINPPPVVAFETAIAAAAAALHVPPFLLHRIIVLAICCVSLLLCLRSLAPRLRGATVVLAGSVLAGILLALPGYAIGQREHISLALMLPYLVGLGIGDVGTGRTVSAAIGVALKPQLAVILLGAEVAQPRRDPRRLAILGGALALIAIASLAWAPGYIPFALHWAPAYESFAHVPWWNPLTNVGGVGLAAAIVVLLLRRRPPVVRTLGWAALGGCIAAALQAKAFGYHWLPAAGCLLGAAGLGLALAGERMHWSRAMLAPLVVLLVAGMQYWVAMATTENPLEMRDELRTALAPYGRGRSILGLTWGVQTGFPMVQELGLRWIEPTSCFWTLDGALAAHRPDLVGEAVALAGAAAQRDRPDLVLVDLAPGTSPGDPPLMTYLAADPSLARLLRTYRLTNHVGRFVILVRPGLAPPAQPDSTGP